MALYRGGQRIAKLYKGATPIARAYKGSALVLNGETIPTPLDGLSNVTGAWSVGRRMFSAWGGAFTTLDSGAFSALLDQSGNTRNFTQATAADRPVPVTAGPQSRAAAYFDGTNDRLIAAAISNFIVNNNGYMIVCAIIDAITTNNAEIYQNDKLMGDSGGFMGLNLKNASGTTTAHGYNWDGDADTTSQAIALDAVRVVEWYHVGGNVHSRVNGSAATPVASGNTSSMTGTLNLAFNGGGPHFLECTIFEAAVFNVTPNDTIKDAIVANMLAYYG